MDTCQSRFHFVNKNALSKSLSKSQGQARFEIFRHAKLHPLKPRSILPNNIVATRGVPKKQSRKSHTALVHDERPLTPDDETSSDNGSCQVARASVPLSLMNASINSPEQHLPPGVFGGSSDPFDTQSIAITARINQLITFIRDSYLPSLYLTPFMRSFTQDCPKDPTMATCSTVLGGPSAIVNWEHLLEGLSSQGGASAWVSSWIPTILHHVDVSEAKEWHMIGLKMRAHSIQALRECLSGKQDIHRLNKPLVLHILWLFRADCINGNTSSATVHARILQPLVEGMEDPLQRTHLFTMILFYDTELAIAKMHKTLFDFDDWVPARLGGFWQTAAPQLPLVPEEYQDLHASIRTASVREAAIRLRRCLAISQTPMALRDSRSVRLGDIMYRWMATRSFSDMGILINVYLDLSENRSYCTQSAERLTEAAIALSVLSVLRKTMHSATINGIDTRDFSHVIFPRLRSTLQQALSISAAKDMPHYQEAYLWMFYVGTQYEKRISEKSPIFTDDPRPGGQWFADNFVRQSILLGLRSWSEIESILGSFLMNPFLGPDLEMWIEDMLAKRTRSPTVTNCSQIRAASGTPTLGHSYI